MFTILSQHKYTLMKICQICKETPKSLSTLPCTHSFCSLCIKGHLLRQSSCPICHRSIQIADVAFPKIFTSQKQGILGFTVNKNVKPRIPQLRPLIFPKLSNLRLKQLCANYKLNPGSRDIMVKRLKQFHVVCNLEQKTNERTVEEIAEFVNNTVNIKRTFNLGTVVHEIKKIRDYFIKKI